MEQNSKSRNKSYIYDQHNPYFQQGCQDHSMGSFDHSIKVCSIVVLGQLYIHMHKNKVKSLLTSTIWASLIAQLVKNLPAMQETPVQFLGWEDPLKKG